MTRWDAAAYDRISGPQVEWAKPVIERLELTGEEVVLDAGCGSGRVTELLVEQAAWVIGIDSDPHMVAHARERLRGRARVLQRDLTWFELDEPVDAVFCNAVLHWIDDHEAVFRRFAAALRPGGRLSFQCGGAGNLVEVLRAAEVSGHSWNYATPEETEERLVAAGFERVVCWLQPWPVMPPDQPEFLEKVVFKDFPDPAALAARVPEGPLDYVRLNAMAYKPSTTLRDGSDSIHREVEG